MKWLHIFRSKPTPEVLRLVEILSGGEEAVHFKLYQDEIDYDHLLELIFSSEKIISWW
jgi:hypothetical protein